MSDFDIGQDVGENRGSVTGVQRAESDDVRQSVHIDFGAKSPREIAEIIDQVPRLSNAVFGDGYSWVGVVEDLRGLKREVASLITRIQTLEHAVTILKDALGERNATSNQMRILLWLVTGGVGVLVFMQVFSQ